MKHLIITLFVSLLSIPALASTGQPADCDFLTGNVFVCYFDGSTGLEIFENSPREIWEVAFSKIKNIIIFGNHKFAVSNIVISGEPVYAFTTTKNRLGSKRINTFAHINRFLFTTL